MDIINNGHSGPRLREVYVEALGDDFALLSGQWLQGPRVAAGLAKAKRVWAFAARGEAEVADQMQAVLRTADGLVVAITPGARPGWASSEREAVAALLGMDPGSAEGTHLGLMLLTEMPACGLACDGLTAGNDRDF